MGYFRAKLVQENLIKASGLPYTIVRSTQFFEFTAAIAQAGTVGQTAHLSPALFQPIASDDVADAVADVALGARSEEHTSELQSLMRISYAVFCLKNKTSRRRNTEVTYHAK